MVNRKNLRHINIDKRNKAGIGVAIFFSLMSLAIVRFYGIAFAAEGTENIADEKIESEALPDETQDMDEETITDSTMEESEMPYSEDEESESRITEEGETWKESECTEPDSLEEESVLLDSEIEEGTVEDPEKDSDMDIEETEEILTEDISDIVNITVPSLFEVALNPYCFAVKTGKNTISTDQVISKAYGILNKSSKDKVITVFLTIEDLNSDKITFVNSADEAINAVEGTYAIYLALVPAASNGVEIRGDGANPGTTAEDLSDVMMTGAKNKAVALHVGQNKVAFLLSKAEYEPRVKKQIFDVTNQQNEDEIFELMELAPGGKGITAFTFEGAMNKKANWSNLSEGIRISVSYSYETASGNETIVGGTSALISAE